jgi:6-phosphogluconate dehydrogenase
MKSMNEKSEVGVIGLGVMGENLLLNIADHGYRAIGLDKDEAKVRALENIKKNSDIWATNDVNVFLSNIRLPRAIILLVPAGQVVDVVLDEIVPLLSKGDLVIDAGNSHFKDTDLREKKLTAKGIYFFGMGVSGGESGARNGPSLMPGGDKSAYERVRPILEAIAAKVNEEPCVAYLGPRSAGHYVKMVHNGIEYGLMQLIAETYHLMKVALNMSDEECSAVYKEWNDSELNSYLLQITSQIFLKKDDETGRPLIDLIKGVAREKGTGKWTCQDAMELQVPVPNIDVAVGMRDLSRFTVEREMANKFLSGPEKHLSGDRDFFLKQLKNAYYASSIITFAQGFSLLRAASSKYQYDLSLESIARIWRGGCIIRASLLDTIVSDETKFPGLRNLLLGSLGGELTSRQADLRAIVKMGTEGGLPLPGMMASVSYYDGFRSAWLPANLIQAQRDYFGAHTYERIDQAGTFHTQWGDR